MSATLLFSDAAAEQLAALKSSDRKKHKKVLKTLGLMESSVRHSGLHTHEFTSLRGPNNEKVFVAYVENRTPSAFRVFWYYGPGKDTLTILAITPHP
jgi:hypothetical protein